MRGLVEGIVDFTSGRAITRSIDMGGGGLLRRAVATDDRDVPPVYMLLERRCLAVCLAGGETRARAGPLAPTADRQG